MSFSTNIQNAEFSQDLTKPYSLISVRVILNATHRLFHLSASFPHKFLIYFYILNLGYSDSREPKYLAVKANAWKKTTKRKVFEKHFKGVFILVFNLWKFSRLKYHCYCTTQYIDMKFGLQLINSFTSYCKKQLLKSMLNFPDVCVKLVSLITILIIFLYFPRILLLYMLPWIDM